MTGRKPPLFDPQDPAFVEDPYPIYRALRDEDPVHRSPMGMWVLTRYADVDAALADPRLGNAPARHAVVHGRNRHRYVAADVASNILPFLDAPRHAGPRRLISRAFGAHLKRHPPDIDGIARRLIAEVRAAGEMEVLSDFATPLSVSVLCQVLGLPVEDEAQLTGWTESFFYLFAPIPSEAVLRQLDKALVEFRRYLGAAVEERRRSSRQDLISELMSAEENGRTLSEIELIDTCMLLFADGVENVDSGIANGVLALLRHPEELRRLREHPEYIQTAVDECLRYESPAQFIARVALEDLTIAGTPIRESQAVLLVLGSANRDPGQFEEPDRLDVARAPNPYLSFGKGRHSCVGAHLVRAELEVALRAILRELPGLALGQPAPRWRPRLGHRWLESLPVTFTAG